MKFCWSKTLQTLSSLQGIPNLHLIGEEIRDSDRYHWTWTDRTPSEVFTIQYTLNGTGTLLYNGRKYIVPPEHCFILQLSKPETTYYLDKAVYNQWHLFYLNFLPSDPNFINSMNEQFGPIHYLPKNAACIKKLMQLENHKADHINFSSVEAYELMNQVFGEVLKNKERENAEENANPLINKTMQLIDERLSEGLNVSDIAAILNVSPEHICRIFKRELGRTPYQIIKERRLNLAERLLLNTNKKISEVALNCGYDSAIAFHNAFKSTYNITPKQYRDR